MDTWYNYYKITEIQRESTLSITKYDEIKLIIDLFAGYAIRMTTVLLGEECIQFDPCDPEHGRGCGMVAAQFAS